MQSFRVVKISKVGDSAHVQREWQPGEYVSAEAAQSAADAATAALDEQEAGRGTRYEVEARELSPH